MGASLLCNGADILMVKRGLEQSQAGFGPLGFQFNNRLQAAPGTPS
jgi:hypothetical protein